MGRSIYDIYIFVSLSMLYWASLLSAHMKINKCGTKATADKVTACNRGKRTDN